MAKTIWISGDTHFGDAHALTLFERPFADVSTMDAHFLEALNRQIGKRDVLIHIGDFCGPMPDGQDAQIEYARKIRQQIRCKKIHLIRGNHDPKSEQFASLFDSVKDQMNFRREIGNERVIVSHYPLRAWRGQLGGALHLYGHTHGALEEVGRSMDVGVDCWKYAPLQLDHALSILVARPVTTPSGWVRRQEIREDIVKDVDDLSAMNARS